MIRSRRVLLSLAVVFAGGCAGVTDGDTVARFDDAELDADLLTDLMTALGPPETDTDAATARDMISTWVRIEAVKDELERDGLTISDEQVDTATQQMSEIVPGFAELPDTTRDYLAGAQAAFLAFGDVAPPTDAELAARYERGPEGSGVTCVRHVLVATESEADAVLAELADGADFAELAAARSTDVETAAVGGNLPCTATGQFRATFVPEFVEATLDARIGEPFGPVESQFGFHVVEIRAFDDVRDELAVAFEPREFAIAEAIERADVSVDPRYGRLVDGRVVPLS